MDSRRSDAHADAVPWELRLAAAGVVFALAEQVNAWFWRKYPVGEVDDAASLEERQRHLRRLQLGNAMASLPGPLLRVVLFVGVWSLLASHRPDGAWLGNLGQRAPLTGLGVGILVGVVGLLRLKQNLRLWQSLAQREASPAAVQMAQRAARRAKSLWLPVFVGVPLLLAVAPQGVVLWYLPTQIVAWLAWGAARFRGGPTSK